MSLHLKQFRLTAALACLIAGVVVAATAAPAAAQSIADGRWTTSEGKMSLASSDGIVRGGYATDNGEIVGQLNGATLNGFWIEDKSGQRCSTAKNGRHYWGRIRFKFTSNAFTGNWGYCEEAVTAGRKWTGSRTSPRAQAAPVAPSASGTPLLDNWNTNACSYTDTTRFSVSGAVSLSSIEVWYRWRRTERTLPFVLSLNHRPLTRGKFVHTGSCDPFQKEWCIGAAKIPLKLAPGRYTLKVAIARQCRNAGSKQNGFVHILGRGPAITNLNGRTPAGQAAKRATARSAFQISGKWQTSEGAMTLTQRGNSISGRYASDNGEITGTLKGNTLSGYWIEDNSNQRCQTAINGRRHWGRIQYVFSGNKFTGYWSYCSNPVSSSNAWTGKR